MCRQTHIQERCKTRGNITRATRTTCNECERYNQHLFVYSGMVSLGDFLEDSRILCARVVFSIVLMSYIIAELQGVVRYM